LFRFKQENRKMLMPSCFFLFLFIYHTGKKKSPRWSPDFNGVCSIIILTILADSFDCIFSWIVRFSFQFIFSFSSQMNFFVSSKIFQFPYTAPRLSLSDSTHTPPFSYLEDTRKTEVYRVTSFEGGKDLKKWTKFWKKKDKKTKIKARSSPTTPPLFNSNLFWEKNQGKNFVFSARAKKLLMSFNVRTIRMITT
jgi:hypothetical protein